MVLNEAERRKREEKKSGGKTYSLPVSIHHQKMTCLKQEKWHEREERNDVAIFSMRKISRS